jgi:hypothetical protein
MKKLLFIYILMLSFVGTACAVQTTEWVNSDPIDGVVYRYDKILGANFNYQALETEHQIVSNQRLCYEDEKYGRVCDSIPVCYVMGFEPGEDGKVVIPQFVKLKVFARTEKMNKYNYRSMYCLFRVVGLIDGREPYGQEKVKELHADISYWTRHNGTEILSKADLKDFDSLEKLYLKETFLDENYNVPNGLTRIPTNLIKPDKLTTLSIEAPNFNIANNSSDLLNQCSKLQAVFFHSSIQNDIPAQMFIGHKNLMTFTLKYRNEDYMNIKSTIG